MTRPWTRLAEKQENFCVVCEEEFYAIRSDARCCSARCRMRFCRSEEGKMKRFKRLAKQHSSQALQQWKLDRKALENRIAQALVDHDSDQLAIAFYEMRDAPFPPGKRRFRKVNQPFIQSRDYAEMQEAAQSWMLGFALLRPTY
jgi:hypothetical protein